MSPGSDIYDHLTNNVHQQPRQIIKSNSGKLYVSNPKSNCESLHMLTKRKCIPFDEHEQSKRRYTITNKPIPETIIHCSVSNQVYEKPMIEKSLTSQTIPINQQTNSKFNRIPTSLSNSEIKPMDFRPLIINGRRKLGGMPSSSMIIIKKKSLSPMNSISFNQKPLTRSIPVDIINSDMAMVISSTIPSSLSYSSSYSSSSSASVSSANVGTVFLPIQVTKSQNSKNNNNNDSIKYSIIATTKEGQRGYRYVQKQSEQQRPFACLKTGNQILLNVDVDESTKIPSSSSIPGEGNNHKSTIMMDSTVLRLIRRYDPVGSNIAGIQARRSLENTRGIWNTVASNTPDSSPFLARRSLTTTYEDDIPVRQSSIPRIQRQQAINEPEPEPSTSINNSLRPILKYNALKSHTELIVQPHQTEPLKIEIEPHIPSINESTSANYQPLKIEIEPHIPSIDENTSTNYQPLITIGTKRVCAALSKSEWDLRLQQEQIPNRSPSPSPIVNNQQQEKESHRTTTTTTTLGRSKSSIGINNTNYEQDDNIDDFDENSAPIINSGSCVQKLKQLFVTKSSLDLTNNSSLNNSHRHDSIDSNLSQRLTFNNKTNIASSSVKPSPPRLSSIEPQQQIINKPTTIVQDVTPTSPFINKKPILKSQKTIERYAI
ncbi:unnamed protein product [Rotaria sp. Silwood2]|nr:unnamed protein product [Rotaria sp. Silwood2]CAF2557714.1 unnamed protein product [Rotaria sp. Silwood2]CAF2972426.1 unnamed protein product [Rotaria sp. Silwood2]CAF3889615.1 unnamed protein product [Rotaria sp. Silwood2]CAF3938170.1 unnamed protein product [Rotaria sp. Silwood2]